MFIIRPTMTIVFIDRHVVVKNLMESALGCVLALQ